MQEKKTLNEYVQEFLNKGGKIQKCPPGEAQNIFKSGVVGTQMKK
jgi:hypothetical protein